MAQILAIEQHEAFVDKECRKGDDESQEEGDKEASEEKIWRQVVPPDAVNLRNRCVVTQPFVRHIEDVKDTACGKREKITFRLIKRHDCIKLIIPTW